MDTNDNPKKATPKDILEESIASLKEVATENETLMGLDAVDSDADEDSNDEKLDIDEDYVKDDPICKDNKPSKETITKKDTNKDLKGEVKFTSEEKLACAIVSFLGLAIISVITFIIVYWKDIANWFNLKYSNIEAMFKSEFSINQLYVIGGFIAFYALVLMVSLITKGLKRACLRGLILLPIIAIPCSVVIIIMKNWDIILQWCLNALYTSIPWAIGVIIICIIFQYIKSTYKCNHCGKEWGLSKIDEDIQDGYSKTEKVGNDYKTYRIQVVKETWRCSSCGNIEIRTRKDKKEI